MIKNDSFYAVSSSFSETKESFYLLVKRIRYFFEKSPKLEEFEKRIQIIQQELNELQKEYQKTIKA